jgi:hypothetical protein
LSTAFAAACPSTVSPLPPVTRTIDPTLASIVTEQGRHEASAEFLNCCRLLAHHDTRSQLTDGATGQRLSPQANLFPRQPTGHFRRNVLGPLFHGHKGYQASVYIYVKALLNRSGVPVESLYAQEFFTAERIKALYSVESWVCPRRLRILPPCRPKHFTFTVLSNASRTFDRIKPCYRPTASWRCKPRVLVQWFTFSLL